MLAGTKHGFATGETDELLSLLELEVTLLMSKDELFSPHPGRNFVTVCMFGEGQSFLSQLIINQRLFLDTNLYLYCMYKLCFLRHPTELLNCSVLDFCRQPSFCLLPIC